MRTKDPHYWRGWITRKNALLGYLIIALAVGFGFFQIEQSFDHIMDLREQRVADQAATDMSVCEANNDQNQILAGLIRGVTKDNNGDDPPEVERRQDRAFEVALEHLRPVDCSKLPSLRPFEE